MGFQDHFSTQAADYALRRPTYPAELFAFLAERSNARECAVDVGAGNGQASLPLAEYFRQVIAVEPSAEQLRHAPTLPRVRFVCAPAESLPLEDACADLIVAGQAAHWFDLELFYQEVRRVARPSARLALWGYGNCTVRDDIDRVIHAFSSDTVGAYWPVGRQLVEDGYRDLAFPFRRLPAPAFRIVRNWSAEQFIDYVSTWSSVARYRAKMQADPLPVLVDGLRPLWTKALDVVWPVAFLFGTVHDNP